MMAKMNVIIVNYNSGNLSSLYNSFKVVKDRKKIEFCLLAITPLKLKKQIG